MGRSANDLFSTAHVDDQEILDEFHEMHVGDKLGLKRYTMRVYQLGLNRGITQKPLSVAETPSAT